MTKKKKPRASLVHIGLEMPIGQQADMLEFQEGSEHRDRAGTSPIYALFKAMGRLQPEKMVKIGTQTRTMPLDLTAWRFWCA